MTLQPRHHRDRDTVALGDRRQRLASIGALDGFGAVAALALAARKTRTTLKLAERRCRRAARDFGCTRKRTQKVRSMQSCEPCVHKSSNK